MLIDLELDGPFARLDFDRYDLVVEQACLEGRLGAAMGFERELVLRVARDPVRVGDVLRRHPHMDLIERVSEGPDHGVNERRVAHPRAPPARSTAARATVAPSSVGAMSRRLHPKEPMAVRAAEAITTSVIT